MKRISTSTKATDLFGVGKHGWRDGNLVAAIKATDGEADWFNHQQEELASVIEAAGIALNPAVFNQLLTALRSAGVFTTPPQFDNGTKAATTAFVKQSGATLSNFYAFNASATLINSYAGGVVEYYGNTSGQALTLPLAANARGADVLTLINYASVPVTIVRQGAEQINWGAGSGGTSLVMQPGDSLQLTAGAGWFVFGGTAENQFSAGFGASKTSNGYQKLPSGLIVQWGVISFVSSFTANATFPIAYPTSCLQTMVTNPTVSTSITTTGASNTTLSCAIASAATTNAAYLSVGY